jgi:hypothetical protein
MNKKTVLDWFDGLGRDADAMADALETRGIVGVIGDVTECPLAQAARAEFADLLGPGETIDFGGDCITIDGVHLYKNLPGVQEDDLVGVLPAGSTPWEFMRRFDDGRYPALIDHVDDDDDDDDEPDLDEDDDDCAADDNPDPDLVGLG